MKSLKDLPQACAAECAAAGVRLNERRNAFLLEGVEDDDGWFAAFDAALVRGARGALEAALRALPPPPRRERAEASWAFLSSPPPPPAPGELEAEIASIKLASSEPAWAAGHARARTRANNVEQFAARNATTKAGALY